ncbi:MAG: protein kinase [Polyangiaceae bacterium]|nr:protein kinase [Polyangiaceae bacterium]
MKRGSTLSGLAGDYEVRARHGAGGFGVTYRALQFSHDGCAARPVLVKELRFDRLREWKALELFEREARVLAALRHARIPAYVDFFAHDGERAHAVTRLAAVAGAQRVRLFLVQTLVPGPTLAARILAGGRATAEGAERLLRELLEVVAYLHAHRPPVIHRDINPRNVVLAGEGEACVTGAHLVDFGAVEDALRSDDALGSTIVGSPGYAPPEQLLGRAEGASDCYALGMTVLAALSRRAPCDMPFDRGSGRVRITALAPGLPSHLVQALTAMTEPAIGRRAPDAAAVHGLLAASATRGAMCSQRLARGARMVATVAALGPLALVVRATAGSATTALAPAGRAAVEGWASTPSPDLWACTRAEERFASCGAEPLRRYGATWARELREARDTLQSAAAMPREGAAAWQARRRCDRVGARQAAACGDPDATLTWQATLDAPTRGLAAGTRCELGVEVESSHCGGAWLRCGDELLFDFVAARAAGQPLPQIWCTIGEQPGYGSGPQRYRVRLGSFVAGDGSLLRVDTGDRTIGLTGPRPAALAVDELSAPRKGGVLFGRRRP